MGCWNETDFLTGLPVFAGDPVRLLFIAQAPDGKWLPASLPFTGEYDDYGGIENAVKDGAALDVLASARLRARTDDNGYEELDASRLRGPDWDAFLRELSNYAVREELEISVSHPGAIVEDWRPAVTLIARDWSWDHIAGAIGPITDEALAAMTFRLSVIGPLRVRLYEASRGSGAVPDGIRNLASLMAGMECMRIGFHPTAGKGSQDAMESPWQLEFHKKLFVEAMGIPRRCDEYGQPPFSAAVAWEEEGLVSDRNNGGMDARDIPDGLEPGELYKSLLSACMDNLLLAMDEAINTEENQE